VNNKLGLITTFPQPIVLDYHTPHFRDLVQSWRIPQDLAAGQSGFISSKQNYVVLSYDSFKSYY